MQNLAEDERQFIKDCIDQGKHLPDDYRFRLFKNPMKAELIWPGKSLDVCKAELPFQTIEHVDAPRLNDAPYAAPTWGSGSSGTLEPFVD